MPYEWLPPNGRTQRLHLWPYRSLTRQGFVWFIGLSAALIAVPLLSTLGTPVLWALLPFLAGTIWALWFALRKNARDREIVEDLTLSPDQITLIRQNPDGTRQDWQANPHWVRLECHKTTGPVPHYLTLQGGPRQVEIGAFLTEEERLLLKDELTRALDRVRNP